MSYKNSHLTRQFDIIPTKILSRPITIIGAGAIGGWVCLSLAKAGFHDITVYDFDDVDTVNMNSQFYRFSDIGKKKVDALHDLVKDFTRVEIVKVPERYTGDKLLRGVVISAVDSMAARKLVWERHEKSRDRDMLVIDPRMGAESALLYAMRPSSAKDRHDYPASLYSDESAIQERCTAKATIYTANLLSGMVVKTVKDWLTTGSYPRSMSWDIAKDDFVCFRSS